jgi:hypothetical protein
MFGKKKKNDAYRHVISLGKTCQPALHMERNNLRVASYPLDWILSPTDSLCTLLSTRFEHFFDKPLLAPQKMTAMNTLEVHHTKLGLVYAHEFKDEKSFETDYDRWKETYDRRIDRFYEVLGGTEKVLFLRFRVTKEDAEKISRTLSGLFPDLPYTLLCVDDTEELKQDWQIPHVINRHILAAPEDDAGSRKYNPVWKKLYQDFPFDLPKTEKGSYFSKKNKFAH